MKKLNSKLLFVAVGIAFATTTKAQTQRLVLAEEFTQASCPPCAAQNPGFNALLNQNTTKVVSIKYQTSWPGVDPMNAENQGDVQSRVTYYGITGVPTALQDGVQLPDPSGQYYTGAPHNWSQTNIDAQYAVPAAFSMAITHHFSPNYDSIYVDCDITCVKDTSGTLVAHIGVIEHEIQFSSPPGTNGEKDFFGVMRKMLPNANGTSLASTWINGQTQHLSFGIPIPSYVRSVSELAVVGFIQDNSTKKIHQAGYSAPQPLPVDGNIAKLSGVPLYQCSGSVNSSIQLKNDGTATLTSCKIAYAVDNNPADTINWTGSIATGTTATVAIPALTIANGSHSINTSIIAANGQKDYNKPNNTNSITANILTTAAAAPFTETYQNANFPADNTFINNPDGNDTWIKGAAGGFGNSSSAMKILMYYAAPGNIDEYYLPLLDLTSLSTNAYVNFDYAHCGVTASNPSDLLNVMVSKDCGANWEQMGSLTGADLNTAPFTNSYFTPTKTQWKTAHIDITKYLTSNSVMVKFVSVAGSDGNFIWVDNANVGNYTQPTGIVNVSQKETMGSVYPNPSKNVAYIELSDLKNNAMLKVVDVTGKTMLSQNVAAGSSIQTIDVTTLEAGMYFYQLVEGKNIIASKKLTVIK